MGLEQNHFSSVRSSDIPMAISQVLHTTARSEEDLLLESISFAIIGRNFELLQDLLDKAITLKFNYGKIFPLHLAAAYLDGSKTCCNLFDYFLLNDPNVKGLRELVGANALGFTVLDNLMINILKSHTTCSPAVVHHSWKTQLRFPGEEVDICGRWDADTPCWRALLSRGNVPVPREWKHKFCHTSAQAICHCVSSLCYFSGAASGGLESPSGLFLAYCPGENCGLKLQLMPLHTLLVIAFLLASSGQEGEDLFGILAVLMTMLYHGASPLDESEVSLPLLLRQDDDGLCSHETLRPLDLAVYIRSRFFSSWTNEVRLGWQTLVKVLEISEKQWDPAGWNERFQERSKERSRYPFPEIDKLEIPLVRSPSEISEDYGTDNVESQSDTTMPWVYGDNCYLGEISEAHSNCLGNDKRLGDIWAIICTEMLTYRRLEEGDPWNSENCDMKALLQYLETGDDSGIGLVEKGLISPERCSCGRFYADVLGSLTMERTSSRYFANLEDWKRITVIPM